jgi:hypothetical protein
MADGGNVSIGSLTASLPVVSDASRNLVSLAYTGATSFRKNLGLETSDSPVFAGLTLTSFSGFVKATAGVLSASALADDDIPDTITLTNITQITNRSHTNLSDIGTLTHATIDSYLDQAVKQGSSPHFYEINIDSFINGVQGSFSSTTSANRHVAQLFAYDNSPVAADVGGIIDFGGKYTTGGLYTQWAGVGGFKDNADGGGGEYGGYLEFYTRATGAALVKRAKITSAGAFIINETLTVTKAFGCNAATAQTAYASGGAAGGTPTLTTGYGFVSAAEMNAHTALVEKIRAALVANGIMS